MNRRGLKFKIFEINSLNKNWKVEDVMVYKI